MAIQAALCGSTLSPMSQYGFFKTFPREIPDNIYDLLLEEIYILPQDMNDPSMILRIPRVDLHLVSSRFKLEYDERILRNEHLTALEVCDDGCFPNESPDSIDLFLTHTTNLTYDLSACHWENCEEEDYLCDARDRFLGHASWISGFEHHLPQLRSIRVIVRVTYDDCMVRALGCLQLITHLTKILEVEIRHTGYRSRGLACVGSEDIPALATWTKEAGLVQDRKRSSSAARAGC